MGGWQRRDVARGLAFLITAAAACGCRANERAEPAAAEARVGIRISGFAGNPAETDLVRRLVDQFNASQSEVRAAYEPVPGQYYPKILTMLVAGTAPDVFYLDALWLDPFLAKRILRPLDDFMARAGMRREEFVPALVDAFTREGTLWGVPKDFNTLALFHNEAMFAEAGVTPPDASWDLERVRAAAKALTRHERRGTRYGFVLSTDTPDRFLAIAPAFGASVYGPDGRCALAGGEGQAAMRWYSAFKLEDGSGASASEVGASFPGDAFGRGDAAMVFEGSWIIPYLGEFYPGVRYGVSELPRGPRGRSNLLFTVAYVIPRASAKAEAAWRLIEFLTSERAQAQVTFALPSRLRASTAYAEAHPAYRPVLAGAAYAAPFELGRRGARVREPRGVAVQEVFLGARSIPAALEAAAADVDAINGR